MNNNRIPLLGKFFVSLVPAGMAVLVLAGCASQKPMTLETKKGAAAGKSVGIFTLRTENSWKPAFEPQVRQIKIMPASGKAQAFVVAKPHKKQSKGFLEYLVSIDMDPGAYTLDEVNGVATGFLISGHFEFPVNGRFELGNGVTYLGHVSMANRERREGEPRSGGVLPLIDQSVVGFAGGTFDVTISDQSQTDIPDFLRTYPKLQGVNIGKAIMTR